MNWYLIALLFCVVVVVTAQSPDFYVVNQRALVSLQPTKENLNCYIAAATEYLNTLQSNGTWADIDYTNTNPAVWPSILHLNPRLLTMTTAYVTPNQPLYNSPTLYAKIELALNYWLTKNPTNSNWWYNDIGAPTPLGEICLQINKTLTLSQRQTAVSYMDRAFLNGATGANYLWMGYVYILKALITGNETLLKEVVAGSFEQVVIAPTNLEGIKQDGSFFQHAMQLYNGGYGENFTQIVLQLVYITVNTSYSISPETLDVWSLFILDGTQWMSNFGYWDYSVRGRELTRPISYYLAFPPEYLAATTGPRHAEWVDFASRISNGSYAPLVGNKHYWIADYMVHHREHFAASVKMYSTRTFNAECVNSEGANSLHLSDGALNIYQTGYEYEWSFPLWDWEKVPGVTCALGEVPSECGTVKQLGKSAFVGGVSNGMYGASVFDFHAALNGTLSARKAWFFFDDEIVALGANITAKYNFPIKTSLNQCIMRTDVYINSETNAVPFAKNATYDDVNWVWQDYVGYVFLESNVSLGITNLYMTGSWSNIGQFSGSITEQIFSAWINHPTNHGGSYQYAIVPGVALETLKSNSSQTVSDVVVIENSPSLQAVLNTKSQVLAAVFWEVGTLHGGPKYTIDVSAPCALLVTINSNQVNTTISDPTQLLTGTVKVSVSMNLSGTNCAYNNDGTSTLLFQLPSGAFAGSSTSILCNLN